MKQAMINYMQQGKNDELYTPTEAIIPNSLKNEFLQKCYEYNKPFMLLLPLTALEGKERGKLYREKGIEVIVLDKRINFMKEKKNVWFNTSWFCHGICDKLLNFEKVGGEDE